MKALAGKFAGLFLHNPPIASGTAAAEAWTGAARGAKDVVLFGAGDRTSAGILRDGAPVTGAHRRAPTVAWPALNPVDREQYRKVGYLEAEVAASWIVRRLIWRVKAGDHSKMQDTIRGELSAVTLDHGLAAAPGGDSVAISVLRGTAKYLGMASANLAATTDSQILVLGGIMASAANLLLDVVRAELGHHLPSPMTQALTIARAALVSDAPAIGAVRLAVASRP